MVMYLNIVTDTCLQRLPVLRDYIFVVVFYDSGYHYLNIGEINAEYRYLGKKIKRRKSSSPSLIRPPYLPRNCGHISEVAFGEREK